MEVVMKTLGVIISRIFLEMAPVASAAHQRVCSKKSMEVKNRKKVYIKSK
jgi:hypothetical protein